MSLRIEDYMEINQLIARINELYHKSKEEGLTEAEQKEQKELRDEYRKAILGNMSAQLNTMSIKHPDGSITKVTKKN